MNWQVPAAGAALGFVFSLLGGLIGGVGFLDLVLRGFLGALIMGGLTAGLQFLLARFLPELFVSENTVESREGGESSSQDSSSRVDITLGEDEVGLQEYAEEGSEGGYEPRAAESSRELPSFGSQVDELGDDLPDVGSLSPLGGQVPEQTYTETQGPEDQSFQSAASVEFEGQQEDPAILARAVQTVMKREGEK